jgi:hypothetical protein
MMNELTEFDLEQSGATPDQAQAKLFGAMSLAYLAAAGDVFDDGGRRVRKYRHSRKSPAR